MKSTSKMTKALLGGTFILLLVFTFVGQAFALGDTWETKASMPTGVTGAAGAVIDGKLYLAGGGTLSGPTNILQVYDRATDTWALLASQPTLVVGAAVGVINGKIYVAGGAINGDTNNTTNLLQVYDRAADSWDLTKAAMPTPRNTMSGAVVDGKLYVFGGMQNCAPCITMNTVEVYDPVADSWSTGAVMPTARRNHGVAAINGKIYVVGGLNLPAPGFPTLPLAAQTFLGILDVYDPVADSWDTTKASIPTPGFDFGVGVINDKLYAVGGDRTTLGIVYTVEE